MSQRLQEVPQFFKEADLPLRELGGKKRRQKIFKKGSTTYFNSSKFFPKKQRAEVAVLYAFVRCADDYVDAQPQKASDFFAFKDSYYKALKEGSCNNPIIDDFLDLARKRKFDPAWTEAFLQAMEKDLSVHNWDSREALLDYVYGSAEVIGLFMCRLLGIPEKAWQGARMQGRAMQLINFIRDIQEDLDLGRQYLPLSESGLEALDETSARARPELFTAFINRQLDWYELCQEEARLYWKYIPYRFRIAIRTASDMYDWTAQEIRKDPFVVYKSKVKPSRRHIVVQGFLNVFRALRT